LLGLRWEGANCFNKRKFHFPEEIKYPSANEMRCLVSKSIKKATLWMSLILNLLPERFYGDYFQKKV
jgi:hypothetical protein